MCTVQCHADQEEEPIENETEASVGPAASAPEAHEAVDVGAEQGALAREARGPSLPEPRRQHERGAREKAEIPHAERVVKARRRGRRTRDPKGGLTAAGREAYRRSEGAHLEPGVRKSMRDMTPDEMRRKGSWAVRFYGRAKLPPLVDAKGRPTRLALTARAWGEPVPRTVSAARRIAAKGRRLLDRYRARQKRR
jgi:hypothetical protein